MRGTFPPGQCRLLCINSLPPESPNTAQPDIWPRPPRGRRFGSFPPPLPQGPHGGADLGIGMGEGGGGQCLSPEDLLAVSEFAKDLALNSVVPSMERRISGLNASVASVRKGMKNVIK
ncbi:unnamed protein product [Discosporangium mesarthrocarpum]